MLKYLLIVSYLTASLGILSCKHPKIHHAIFYKKLGKDADKDGFHHNEAQRVLEYNEMNKEANEKHAIETQQTIGESLNTINQPNNYNAKTQKVKKKRFTFYL
jgi:hypothetical protein